MTNYGRGLILIAIAALSLGVTLIVPSDGRGPWERFSDVVLGIGAGIIMPKDDRKGNTVEKKETPTDEA